MKSVLKLDLHKVLPGQQVVEIWHGDKFIGTVTGADGPGVRIMSKYPIAKSYEAWGHNINVVDMEIKL